MGPKAERIVSAAFDKVMARHRASGTMVPFEQFAREVIAEVSAEAGRIEARSFRRIRRAERQILEAAELIAVMGRSPMFGDTALERWLAGFDAASVFADEQEQPGPLGGHGAPVPGPPAWHPEHPSQDNN